MLFSSSTSFIPWHSLEEVRAEFAEFQESSGELEGELEAQLDQVEKSNKDLMHRVSRLDDENESLKSKLDSQQAEAFVTISTLQEERVELLALKDALQKYIRQLEQNNDDLERGKRVTVSSLEDFESKLNHAFERNAILENELDEKQRLPEMCQRLKDEVKELRSELNRKHRRAGSDEGAEQSGSAPQEEPASSAAPPRIATSSSSTSHPHTPSTTTSPSPLIHTHTNPSTEPGTPRTAFTGIQNYTPSTRISALNMVGDLLRKVGALESRLASCRTHISTKDGRSTNTPATDSSR
jgi:peptidoglycan hydrolase CwlO-like protein